MNKISHVRFQEEVERGFDILTNQELQGPDAEKKSYNVGLNKPRGVWTKTLSTVNRDFMNNDELDTVEREKEDLRFRETQTLSEFHRTQKEGLM